MYVSGTSCSFPTTLNVVAAGDDSESDAVSGLENSEGLATNAFGQSKTKRYNRGPRDKSQLEEREKIATRRSKRIKDMLDDKKKLDSVITHIFKFIHTSII